MDLSPYEQRALKEIEEHKRRLLRQPGRQLVSEDARKKFAAAGDKSSAQLGRIPGFVKSAAAARTGYLKAASGFGEFTTRSAQLTLSEERIVKAFSKCGHDIENLADIHNLDLRDVEKRILPRYFTDLYAAGGAIEGAAAGAVISGGELLAAFGTVAGAGAGGAPGTGTVVAAVAVDAAALLGICSRVVAHTAMYYGYDPSEPGEAIFAMSVMNLGSALTQSGKYAAFIELSKVTQGLARNATWAALNRHALPQVASRFARAFGVRMTKAKLGQFVPLVGIFTGASLNYLIVRRVANAAHWSYRERFINDKRDVAGLYVPPPPSDLSPLADDEIDLIQIIEATEED